jgi:hypothetical protein
MKKTGFWAVVLLALVGSIILLTYKAKSELEVSASVQVHTPDDFYGPLAAHGSWVEVGAYGRCFHPAGVDAEWRPYCEGSWVWTDCGWYWDTDEPWGWACYHYGTWVDDPAQGWIWVPGIEWAPAWVTWRTGGDYIGWAPCAPLGASVAPALFVFVDVNHFQGAIRRTSITVNNTTAINETRVLAAPGREKRNIDGRTQDVVINHGPDVEQIEKATGRQLKAVPVGEANHDTAAPRNLQPNGNKTEPTDIRQPVAPNQDQPPRTEPHDEATPVRPPDYVPQKPAETGPPVIERPENPPKRQQPGPPSREQKPEGQPKEEKPATPPPSEDKKDGLERIPTMMATVPDNSPADAGRS